MAGAVAAMGLVAACETAIPALLKPLIDSGFTGAYNGKIWYVPAALIGLALARGLAQFLSNYLLNRVSNHVLLALRTQMFDRMLQAPATLYHEQPVSTLIHTVVHEVNQVLQVLTGVVITMVRDSLTVLGLLLYLFYLNWRLTLIVSIVIPGIGYVMSKVNKRLRKLNREHQHMTKSLSYVVQEAAAGYKVVKIHGGEAYELSRFTAMSQKLRGYAMRMAVAGGLNQPVTQLLASIALSVVIVIALLQSSAQQTTVGGFASFVMAMILIISPLKHLTDINQPLQRGLTAAESIFGMIDTPSEASLQTVQGHLPETRARGELTFDQVSFAYPPSKVGQQPRLALDGIQLHIRPGEALALVGPSGSGKTTLANLLPRFLLPTSGRILLDGVPLEALPLHELRRQMALVSQEVVLFNDTIAANVAYGAPTTEQIDMERVARAVEAAHLSDVVASMPDGLESIIGDNGGRLSGGQRQRLAIARAIYKDAPILILDEATSALDSESERQVQAALETLMQGRTTLVIAHRLSTIEKADRIVVLEQGRVVEQGSHADLLAADGLYANLHRIQFSGRPVDADVEELG